MEKGDNVSLEDAAQKKTVGAAVLEDEVVLPVTTSLLCPQAVEVCRKAAQRPKINVGNWRSKDYHLLINDINGFRENTSEIVSIF